jgi:NADPH2:quinone reductase
VLAVEIARHGGPEQLAVVERPDPVPAAGQLLVRNRWIGVNVELDVAAAIALSGTTGYVLTRQAYPVAAGQVAVVHAAAGATGGAVVQLAAAAGADVIAITSTPGKAAEAAALGASHTIAQQDTPDLAAAVLSVTGGRGADVVYDGTGRDTFDASLDMLATRGTLVLYGQSSGPVAPFDPGRLSGITGAGRGAGSLTLRWASAGHYLTGAEDRARALGAVLDQVAAGRFSPRIAGRFPLRQASETHVRLASREISGKLLLHA